MKVTIIIPVYNQEKLVIRALNSIPDFEWIETIVIDDGSTDNTYSILKTYNEKQFILLKNPKNMGVSYTINKGLDYAKGEYIVLLGSDDYFYTNEFIKTTELLDGTDLVYFNLKTNNGTIFDLSQETKMLYCGSTKFIKRELIGNIRNDENKKSGEDYYFYKELLKKNPTEKFTHIIAKHYNFPRKGSLSYLQREGII